MTIIDVDWRDYDRFDGALSQQVGGKTLDRKQQRLPWTGKSP
jgi:hypothetical protein